MKFYEKPNMTVETLVIDDSIAAVDNAGTVSVLEQPTDDFNNMFGKN